MADAGNQTGSWISFARRACVRHDGRMGHRPWTEVPLAVRLAHGGILG